MRKRFVLKTWQILVLAFLLAFCTAGIVTAFSLSGDRSSKETCRHGHKTQKSFFEDMRFSPPVKIYSIEGDRIEFTSDEKGIELGSLELELEYSIVPKDLHIEGQYSFIYCQKHHVVLQADEVEVDDKGGIKAVVKDNRAKNPPCSDTTTAKTAKMK